MIEFSGQISQNCMEQFFREEKKLIFLIFFVICSIFNIFFIILSLKANPLFFVFVAYLFLIPFLFLIPTPRKIAKSTYYGMVFPFRICIDEDMLESEGEKFYYTRSMSDVKKVIDYGEWYHIIFFFPYKKRSFVCQKNLITQGAIEDFEKMFEDELVRKVIKKDR